MLEVLTNASLADLAVDGDISAHQTNEEASQLKALFGDRLGVKNIDVMVDPIGPIRMKSRTQWLVGTQGAPNYRGVQKAIGDETTKKIEDLLTRGADGIDVLYICDAGFSERTRDAAVAANLRKAKFVVVHSWDATHPLSETADVVLPSTNHAEKEGTYTNLQGRSQQIHQAYAPKGQAVPDLEIFRRLGGHLFAEEAAVAGAR